MGSKLSPYPEYRESSLAWLPRVPSQWDVRRLKYVFREVVDRTETGEEVLLSLRQFRGLVPHKDVSKKPIDASDVIGFKRVQAGQFVLNRMRASSGMMAFSTRDGLVSPDYAVFQPLCPADPRFLVYLMQTRELGAEFRRQSKGLGTGTAGFLRLYTDRFGATAIPFPPPEEQRRLADHLDAHGRLTTRLIRNRRRMLAVLKERRQGIINDAVTRGVNPAAAMKAMPLDSVPLIPSHWQLKRLKYLTRFSNGIAFKPSDWKDAGTPIIRIENLNGSDQFNYTDRADLPERLLIQPGDLLFAWSGNRGTSFGSFEWDRAFPAYLNQHIFKLESFSLHRRFFFYALRAVTKRVEDNAHGIIGLVHVTKPELGAIEVPVPPPDEQEAIANHLDRVLGEINAAAEKLVREIKLVEEYRERLIADAVTGKLDVRAAALAMLADESDGEAPPLEDEEATTAEDADDEDNADVALAEVDE